MLSSGILGIDDSHLDGLGYYQLTWMNKQEVARPWLGCNGMLFSNL